MVSTRSLVGTLLLAGAAACNAITGTGKYEVVDCPSGSCGDGGNPGTDAPTGGDAPIADAGSDVDARAEPFPTCGAGRAPVRLIVTGAPGGSVSSNPGGLSVATGSTQTACLDINTTVLRTSGPTATWTGARCKDGNSGRDRCEFDVEPGGMTLTAALP